MVDRGISVQKGSEATVLIPGVPDHKLEQLHWNHGGGEGTLGDRHVPSGITVSKETPSDRPVWVAYQELAAELKERLAAAGVVRTT
jgi:hypothetical protein